VRASLLALRTLLQSHDTAAADHLAQHAPLLGVALGAQLAALAGEVQGFAFEAALARVDGLLAAMPAAPPATTPATTPANTLAT